MKAHQGRRVLTFALGDAIAKLPEAQELQTDDVPESDLLIEVLGFEERCLAIPNALLDAGHNAGSVAVCRYPTNPADNRRNEERCRSASLGSARSLRRSFVLPRIFLEPCATSLDLAREAELNRCG